MTDDALIDGNYADFKLVKTRSVCQLVIEVPIERAEAAIKAFGMPQPGSEIPVVIARLVASAQSAPAPQTASERGKIAYQSSSPGEQARARAILLCRDPDFQAWAQATDEAEAATFIRRKCQVNTRGAFATNARALATFLELETEFKKSLRFGGR